MLQSVLEPEQQTFSCHAHLIGLYNYCTPVSQLINYPFIFIRMPSGCEDNYLFIHHEKGDVLKY